MKECIETLNQMVEAGVILRYAIFGAVAQMRYTDDVATEELAAAADSRGLSDKWNQFQRKTT